MVNDIKQEIEIAKAKVAELEGFLKNQGKLARLPFDYGYTDLKSFIKALKRAAGSKPAMGRKPGKAPKIVKARKGRRGKRARITPEIKEAVKAAVVAGKTGSVIAKEFGISLPSVQNIKKEFGLVKPRA